MLVLPGSILTKDPHDISLLEVYLAVQNKDDLFSIHENTNPNCTVGKNIQNTIRGVISSGADSNGK